MARITLSTISVVFFMIVFQQNTLVASSVVKSGNAAADSLRAGKLMSACIKRHKNSLKN